MISLYRYIGESFSNTRRMGEYEWFHRGDYKYINIIIDDILSDKPIIVLSKTNGVIELSPDNFDKSKIIELKNNLKDRDLTSLDDTLLDKSIIDDLVVTHLKDYTGDHLWTSIIKRPYSVGNRVSTKDQETATCLVWNSLMYILKDINTEVDRDLIDNIVSKISNNFDNDWKFNFYNQYESIKKLLQKYYHIDDSDIHKFRLRRYGDSIDDSILQKELSDTYEEDIENSQKLVNTYKEFVDTYCRSINRIFDSKSNKDSYDPSDVILFRTDSISDNISKLNNLIDILKDATEEELNKVHSDFIDIFYKGDLSLAGISLKKLTGSGRVELVNVGSGINTISVSSIDRVNISDSYKTMNIILSGNFKLGNTAFDDNTSSKEEFNKLRLNIRSKGRYIMMDTMLLDGRKETSLGKCPIDIWLDVFNMKNTSRTSNNISNVISSIHKQLEDNDILEKLEICIEASLKKGPWCLPFIIIH